jgi:hypothetical protein
LPPERRDTSSSRATLARVSFTVATVCCTRACAPASAARERTIWSRSLAVSSSTSTWPLRMRSLTSTWTLATVPDNSLPMLTERVGCNVPLAVTVSVRSPRATVCVT